MPELREVFEMVRSKTEPVPDAWEEQEHRQRRTTRRRKTAAFALAAAIGVVAVVIVIGTLGDEPGTEPGAQPIPSGQPIPPLPSGFVEPGRYVVASREPGLAGSYRISIEVPVGYDGYDSFFVLKRSFSTEAAVGAMAISGVFADPCQWKGTLLDGSAVSSTDDVVAALENQTGLRVSTPTDVTVDGLAGTYMERRVPAQTRISDCDGAETPEQAPVFNVYRSPGYGNRLLHPGQLQQLWILDLDGVPLVIEASSDAGTSAQVQAELVEMVESVQIDPR
jgi:hypothetical protein